jgi:N-methylhydantoinase A
MPYRKISTDLRLGAISQWLGRVLDDPEGVCRHVNEIEAPLLLMQSNGGLTTAKVAAELSMHIVESGPAAGVVNAATGPIQP